MLADEHAGCQAGIPDIGQAVHLTARLTGGFSMPRDRNAEALHAREQAGVSALREGLGGRSVFPTGGDHFPVLHRREMTPQLG